MEDPNHDGNCVVGRRRGRLRGDSHHRFHPNRCRHGIVISISAKTERRSRSRWNPCSRSPGIGVHDALETAFTVGRNMHVSTMHAHLDHDQCIETVMLKGPVKRVDLA